MSEMKNKKLVIVGDSAFAEVAYEYFAHDSPYEVVGFSVEREYQKRDHLFDLPIVDFENIEARFSPAEHEVYVAVVYSQLNRLRARLYGAAKRKGYTMASYISSRAFVWRNAEIGEHCFIFEDNTVQPFVKIGDNCVLWSGNHVGHHSSIGNHCFVSSHVVISGFVNVGDFVFLGVNSTISNNVTIAKDCWIGLGVTIKRDTLEGQLYRPESIEPATVSAPRFFKVKE
jgi:sugar O-acyltransferase (sialic acid O-acetyltransferase NeuD family)